jgi:hypothetical protein
MRRVRLERLDLARFVALEEHHEAMLREFALIAIGAETGQATQVPAQLLDLVGGLRERFAGQRELLFTQVRAAIGSGAATTDVELDLPSEAAPLLREVLEAYEAADDYCRSGELLTLTCPPEVAAFRRDLVTEITAQLTAPAPARG